MDRSDADLLSGNNLVEDSDEGSKPASSLRDNGNPQPIFVGNGAPIKFFIQQDTGEGFLKWLSAKITVCFERSKSKQGHPHFVADRNMEEQ